jgi:SSS family solute:Na+ symporter
MSKPKAVSELHNLVYGVTDIPHEKAVVWYKRPGVLAVIVGVVLVILNLLYW